MSVIFFSEDELGNLASVYVARAGRIVSQETRDQLRAEVSKTLAAYSRANARAYKERYGQKVRPHTAEEIAFHSTLVGINDADARGTFRLLTYNAREGKDYVTGPLAKGLLEIARVLLQNADSHGFA